MINDFALNGRFLSQNMTGVQRYAYNVMFGIATHLKDLNSSMNVVVPPNTPDPKIERMRHHVIGPLNGHAWEQVSLPLRWRGGLLNLCNTASVIKRNQIVCIHDLNVLEAPHSYSRSFRAAYNIILPLVAKGSAVITTVSKNSAAQISHHFSMPIDRIRVLPNGHEHVKEWNPNNVSPRILNEVGTDGQPFILVIGSRAPHKNIRLIANISGRLADLGVSVLIAGGKSSIFSAEALSFSDNCKFIGAISDDDLSFLMRKALCLAFPSITEGFGLPIVEAMALGCPVVSSDRASMPEVCGGAALLAPPDDPYTWIANIESLKVSNSLRHEMIERGYQQVKKFSWNATSSEYIDLTQNLAR